MIVALLLALVFGALAFALYMIQLAAPLRPRRMRRRRQRGPADPLPRKPAGPPPQ